MKLYSDNHDQYVEDCEALKEQWIELRQTHLQEKPGVLQGELVVIDRMFETLFEELEDA